MAEQAILKDRTKDKPTQDELTTLIWTPEMGRRLAIFRMKQLQDQREFARSLEAPGVTQGTISRIELGRLSVTDRLTVARLKSRLGNAFMFVVYGSNPERFNVGLIHRHYWDTRLRIRRKNKGQFSKPRWKY